MCATVCPSQALYYGTREAIERLRQRSRPINQFQFGRQQISTRVHMMVPRSTTIERLDVTGAMHQDALGQAVESNVFG
jgi:hypothetical protein